jgi:hypothetical protein
MQLIKNERIIREYRYNDIYQRRKMLRIWNSEIKPDGKSCYELIIKPEPDGYIG